MYQKHRKKQTCSVDHSCVRLYGRQGSLAAIHRLGFREQDLGHANVHRSCPRWHRRSQTVKRQLKTPRLAGTRTKSARRAPSV